MSGLTFAFQDDAHRFNSRTVVDSGQTVGYVNERTISDLVQYATDVVCPQADTSHSELWQFLLHTIGYSRSSTSRSSSSSPLKVAGSQSVSQSVTQPSKPAQRIPSDFPQPASPPIYQLAAAVVYIMLSKKTGCLPVLNES